MFTGIIEEVGTVQSLQQHGTGARLVIACRTVLDDASLGCSIAVNGVCLTAVALESSLFAADLAPETLSRTNLGELTPGSLVNLERPLAPTGRLSGHIVQGHVDGTAQLLALRELGDGNWWLEVELPSGLEPYTVFKGSITLNGVSLTIARLEGTRLGVAIIPHTYSHTNLHTQQPGGWLNVECDVLAKHVAKLLGRLDLSQAMASSVPA